MIRKTDSNKVKIRYAGSVDIHDSSKKSVLNADAFMNFQEPALTIERKKPSQVPVKVPNRRSSDEASLNNSTKNYKKRVRQYKISFSYTCSTGDDMTNIHPKIISLQRLDQVTTNSDHQFVADKLKPVMSRIVHRLIQEYKKSKGNANIQCKEAEEKSVTTNTYTLSISSHESFQKRTSQAKKVQNYRKSISPYLVNSYSSNTSFGKSFLNVSVDHSKDDIKSLNENTKSKVSKNRSLKQNFNRQVKRLKKYNSSYKLDSLESEFCKNESVEIVCSERKNLINSDLVKDTFLFKKMKIIHSLNIDILKLILKPSISVCKLSLYYSTKDVMISEIGFLFSSLICNILNPDVFKSYLEDLISYRRNIHFPQFDLVESIQHDSIIINDNHDILCSVSDQEICQKFSKIPSIVDSNRSNEKYSKSSTSSIGSENLNSKEQQMQLALPSNTEYLKAKKSNSSEVANVVLDLSKIPSKVTNERNSLSVDNIEESLLSSEVGAMEDCPICQGDPVICLETEGRPSLIENYVNLLQESDGIIVKRLSNNSIDMEDLKLLLYKFMAENDAYPSPKIKEEMVKTQENLIEKHAMDEERRASRMKNNDVDDKSEKSFRSSRRSKGASILFDTPVFEKHMKLANTFLKNLTQKVTEHKVNHKDELSSKLDFYSMESSKLAEDVNKSLEESKREYVLQTNSFDKSGYESVGLKANRDYGSVGNLVNDWLLNSKEDSKDDLKDDLKQIQHSQMGSLKSNVVINDGSDYLMSNVDLIETLPLNEDHEMQISRLSLPKPTRLSVKVRDTPRTTISQQIKDNSRIADKDITIGETKDVKDGISGENHIPIKDMILQTSKTQLPEKTNDSNVHRKLSILKTENDNTNDLSRDTELKSGGSKSKDFELFDRATPTRQLSETKFKDKPHESADLDQIPSSAIYVEIEVKRSSVTNAKSTKDDIRDYSSGSLSNSMKKISTFFNTASKKEHEANVDDSSSESSSKSVSSQDTSFDLSAKYRNESPELMKLFNRISWENSAKLKSKLKLNRSQEDIPQRQNEDIQIMEVLSERKPSNYSNVKHVSSAFRSPINEHDKKITTTSDLNDVNVNDLEKKRSAEHRINVSSQASVGEDKYVQSDLDHLTNPLRSSFKKQFLEDSEKMKPQNGKKLEDCLDLDIYQRHLTNKEIDDLLERLRNILSKSEAFLHVLSSIFSNTPKATESDTVNIPKDFYLMLKELCQNKDRNSQDDQALKEITLSEICKMLGLFEKGDLKGLSKPVQMTDTRNDCDEISNKLANAELIGYIKKFMDDVKAEKYCVESKDCSESDINVIDKIVRCVIQKLIENNNITITDDDTIRNSPFDRKIPRFSDSAIRKDMPKLTTLDETLRTLEHKKFTSKSMENVHPYDCDRYNFKPNKMKKFNTATFMGDVNPDDCYQISAIKNRKPISISSVIEDCLPSESKSLIRKKSMEKKTINSLIVCDEIVDRMKDLLLQVKKSQKEIRSNSSSELKLPGNSFKRQPHSDRSLATNEDDSKLMRSLSANCLQSNNVTPKPFVSRHTVASIQNMVSTPFLKQKMASGTRNIRKEIKDKSNRVYLNSKTRYNMIYANRNEHKTSNQNSNNRKVFK